MMIPWRRLATFMVRKIADNPETRAKAADLAQKVGLEAKRVAGSPNRARAAGQAFRRVGNELRQKLQSSDEPTRKE